VNALYLGLAIAAGAVLTYRVLVAISRAQPDDKWEPTGIKRKFDGYDEAKALAGKRRAEQHANARRRLEAARLERRRRRPAHVHRIDERQAR
jgi:hypothetical protein